MKGLICDGASSNLSMVKRLCNEYGADVGLNEDTHCEDEETPKMFFFRIRFLMKIVM